MIAIVIVTEEKDERETRHVDAMIQMSVLPYSHFQILVAVMMILYSQEHLVDFRIRIPVVAKTRANNLERKRLIGVSLT